MFVDKGYHFAQAQLDVLNELTSTSTELVLGAEEGTHETLWLRLKTLAQNFVDGVLTLTGINAKVVYTMDLEAENVKTDELCIGTTCVNESQLKALLQDTITSPNNPVDTEDDTPPPVDEDQEGPGPSDETEDDNATSTDNGTTTPKVIIIATSTDDGTERSASEANNSGEEVIVDEIEEENLTEPEVIEIEPLTVDEEADETTDNETGSPTNNDPVTTPEENPTT
jgi:hypothetical protein